MTTADLRRAKAGVQMWLINTYYADLAAYYDGDEGRFSRMVVDGGKTLPTAHPAGWVQHITGCTTADCAEFYPIALAEIYAQLQAWGHDAKLPEVQP